MNVIFKVEVDKNGCLELKTADLSEPNFCELRRRLYGTKRIVIDVNTKGWCTSLGANIYNESEYVPYHSSKESANK